MQHFAPAHFARTAWTAPVAQERLTLQQWIAAYTSECDSLGVRPAFRHGLAHAQDHWEFNETTRYIAEGSLKRQEWAAEGFYE